MPSHLVAPVLQRRVGVAFIPVGPAGVEVAEKDGLVCGVPLVFVHLSHDEVLYICEWVRLDGLSWIGVGGGIGRCGRGGRIGVGCLRVEPPSMC